MVSPVEQRASRRFDVDWPVCVWHEGSQRFYTGRSSNVSRDGALVYLPISAPVRNAESLEINFPAELPDEPMRTPGRTFSARVVRVNRGQSILEARQAIGLQFVAE